MRRKTLRIITALVVAITGTTSAQAASATRHLTGQRQGNVVVLTRVGTARVFQNGAHTRRIAKAEMLSRRALRVLRLLRLKNNEISALRRATPRPCTLRAGVVLPMSWGNGRGLVGIETVMLDPKVFPHGEAAWCFNAVFRTRAVVQRTAWTVYKKVPTADGGYDIYEKRTITRRFRQREVEVIAPTICFNISLLRHGAGHRVVTSLKQVRHRHVAPLVVVKPAVSIKCLEIEGNDTGSDGGRPPTDCRVGDDTLQVCYTATGANGNPVTVVSFADDGKHGAYFKPNDPCMYIPPMLHHTTADTVTITVADTKNPKLTATASLFIDREWVN
jgi:hypothetical protein